jgi:hypothetical protein
MAGHGDCSSLLLYGADALEPVIEGGRWLKPVAAGAEFDPNVSGEKCAQEE